MKKVKVISRKNLPVKPPIISTAVAYLILDKFNAVGWIWGIVGTLYFLLWAGYIYTIIHQDDINLFEDEKEEPSEQKLNFKERIEKMKAMNERLRSMRS